MRKPYMKEVESSLIKRIWYDRRNKILHIRFNSGGYYIYYGVSYYRYRKLLHAESKGKYFLKYIRNNYEYAKLE